MIERIVLFLKCARALHTGGKVSIIAHVFSIIRIMIGMQRKKYNGCIFTSCIWFRRKLYGDLILFFPSFIEFKNEFLIFWEYKRSFFWKT